MSEGRQYGIGSIFPDNQAYYVYDDGHVELHMVPENQDFLIRDFSDFLRERLKGHPKLEVVERKSCYFAVLLKSDSIRECNNEKIAQNELKRIVDPIISDYIGVLKDVSIIANKLTKYYEDQTENEPCHINLIDELHANENAHSRILLCLLKYKRDGCKSILRSFLSLLNGWDSSGLSIGSPSISFGTEYIDGLIEERGSYAVIIENKIHGAVDQNEQIKRYVETVIGHGIPVSHIWVVYLTRDGSKTVSDYSYTDKVQGIVEDRFIPLSYKYDILPWLENTILPSCQIREEWLVSALFQYIDHLKGMFGLRVSQTEVQRKTAKILLGLSGVENDIVAEYDVFRRKELQLNALRDIVSNAREQIEESVMKSFTEISKKYFEARYPVELKDFHRYGYYQVVPQGWPCNVHLEWVPLKICENSLRLVLHIETYRNRNMTELIERLQKDSAFQSYNEKKRDREGLDRRTFFAYTEELPTPFIGLSEPERENLITRIYDNVCGIIPIVYRLLNKIGDKDSLQAT